MNKIKGGYYLKARCIQDSDIAHAPPHVREIWDWILKEANHSDTKTCKRGQTVRTYKDIQEGLSWQIGWRKMTYSKWDCEKAIKWLSKEKMIEVKKTTRGMVVTVLNYDKFQDSDSYETQYEKSKNPNVLRRKNESHNESHMESHTESHNDETKKELTIDKIIDSKIYESHNENNTKATGEPQTTDTINKNVKNEKNKQEEIITYVQPEVADPTNKIFGIFYKINPTINFGNKTERSAVEELVKLLGEEKVTKLAEFAVHIFGEQYAPSITSPLELKNKLSKLINHWKKQQSSTQTNMVKI